MHPATIINCERQEPLFNDQTEQARPSKPRGKKMFTTKIIQESQS
jgi:hypothetical protein